MKDKHVPRDRSIETTLAVKLLLSEQDDVTNPAANTANTTDFRAQLPTRIGLPFERLLASRLPIAAPVVSSLANALPVLHRLLAGTPRRRAKDSTIARRRHLVPRTA
jgi:hypothetical protein